MATKKKAKKKIGAKHRAHVKVSIARAGEFEVEIPIDFKNHSYSYGGSLAKFIDGEVMDRIKVKVLNLRALENLREAFEDERTDL